MSTQTYPLGMTRQGMLPAITKLSARDFKVCEACGGPAMQHPRHEIGQNIAGGREILCCSCLRASIEPLAQRAMRGQFRIGDQLWRCNHCHRDRAWGLLEPADRQLVPALECVNCQASTRHVYLRVA